MDPYYPLLFIAYFLLIFAGFGLIFGSVGTLLVLAGSYLQADMRVAGILFFFCGCAAKICYGSQMPPAPGSIPLLTTIAGFLIHPLFFAAGVLVFSGFARYFACRRTETVFSAVFLAAGITAVLGGRGFFTALQSGREALWAPDFAVIPSLVGGVFDAAVAGLLFMGGCEACLLLQRERRGNGPEA